MSRRAVSFPVSTIRALFFDFDGVILDSVEIKTWAFEKLFEPYGKGVQRKVVRHHRANGGVSRFEKIRHYYQTFLHKRISRQELETQCDTFSNLVFDEVLAAEWIPGAKEFLERTCKRFKLFVVSGTPEDEMKIIIKRRGLEGYFADVAGSPRTKGQLVQDLLRRHSLEPRAVLYFGDAVTDYDAAVQSGVHFISINCKSPLPSEVPQFDNFAALMKKLPQLVEPTAS